MLPVLAPDSLRDVLHRRLSEALARKAGKSCLQYGMPPGFCRRAMLGTANYHTLMAPYGETLVYF